MADGECRIGQCKVERGRDVLYKRGLERAVGSFDRDRSVVSALCSRPDVDMYPFLETETGKLLKRDVQDETVLQDFTISPKGAPISSLAVQVYLVLSSPI